jgi:N-acetylglucosaminyldiphosphoundecaprenol N-acetyl-beta-D-mannosaminyltransferase
MRRLDIMGVEILDTTLDEITKALEEDLQRGNKVKVFTPNTEIVMAARKSIRLRDEVNKGTYVIPDGIGLLHGARLRGVEIRERVTGYDTSMELLRIANDNGYSLFLIGCREGVAEEAAMNIQRDYPGIRIAGHHHGYFKGTHTNSPGEEEERVIELIHKSKADIIFVGFGFPRQEVWINSHMDNLGVKVAIGNGGVIDILAGRAKRAPEIFIKLGLEWLYRLISDPSRIKRQIVLPLFLIRVMLEKDSIKRL